MASQTVSIGASIYQMVTKLYFIIAPLRIEQRLRQRSVDFQFFHHYGFNDDIPQIAANHFDRELALCIQPQFATVDMADRDTARSGHDQMQNRAPVHAVSGARTRVFGIAQYLGVAALPQDADIFEQHPDIRLIHAHTAQTPDQRITGIQTEFREMLNTKRPHAHTPGIRIVNQQRAVMWTNKFHAHKTRFLVVIANVLLAAGMSGVDGDTVGLDCAVMLDGASQRVWWSIGGGNTGERCGKHQG